MTNKLGKMSAAGLFLVLSLGLASCNAKADADTSGDKMENAGIEASDTLIINKVGIDSVRNFQGDDDFLSDYLVGLEASIEVPSFDQNPVLARAIMEWVAEGLGSRYEGDLRNADAMLKQLLDDQKEDEYMQVEVSKLYETPKVVTFLMNTYVTPVGAAHGSAVAQGATFRKSDGKIFGSNMIANHVDRLIQPILKDGLKAYFEASTDEELENAMMLESPYTVDYLPMPDTDPWVTSEGIIFCYQQYEVACYAAGMPTVVVPLQKAKDLLTPFAKEVLDLK